MINRLVSFLKAYKLNVINRGKIQIDIFKSRIGKNSEIKSLNNGKCILNNVILRSNCNIVSNKGEILLGKNIFLNHNCIIYSHKRISIGDNCLFGPNVVIYDHDHIFDKHGIKDGFKSNEIVIEEGCWIGANVTILRGTYIGKKTIIGAGSIIKGNIPAYSKVYSKNQLKIERIH